MEGTAVLKRSPDITTKSTTLCMQVVIAREKLWWPSLLSRSSLQPPRWQSAIWANFMLFLLWNDGFIIICSLYGMLKKPSLSHLRVTDSKSNVGDKLFLLKFHYF